MIINYDLFIKYKKNKFLLLACEVGGVAQAVRPKSASELKIN